MPTQNSEHCLEIVAVCIWHCFVSPSKVVVSWLIKFELFISLLNELEFHAFGFIRMAAKH
jgi:hypothetical protein